MRAMKKIAELEIGAASGELQERFDVSTGGGDDKLAIVQDHYAAGHFFCGNAFARNVGGHKL